MSVASPCSHFVAVNGRVLDFCMTWETPFASFPFSFCSWSCSTLWPVLSAAQILGSLERSQYEPATVEMPFDT